MTTEFLTNEMLSAEQLDLVAGGSDIQNAEDVLFFYELGYDVGSTELKDAFAKNGVKFSDSYDNNSYKILTGNGEWTQHPHWAALGYILSKRNYPGFNGIWTDANYVKSFIKDNFGINNID